MTIEAWTHPLLAQSPETEAEADQDEQGDDRADNDARVETACAGWRLGILDTCDGRTGRLRAAKASRSRY